MFFQFLVIFVVAVQSVKGEDTNCPPSKFFCHHNPPQCCYLRNQTCHGVIGECVSVFEKTNLTVAEEKKICCDEFNTEKGKPALRQACVYLFGLHNYQETCEKLEAQGKLEKDVSISSSTRGTVSTASGTTANPHTSPSSTTFEHQDAILGIVSVILIITIIILVVGLLLVFLIWRREGYQPVSQDGRPTAPIGVIKTTENSRDLAKIHWEKPESDGGSPITGYLVERREGSNGAWEVHRSAGADATSVECETPSENHYYFRVYAVNKNGPSKPLNFERAITLTQISVSGDDARGRMKRGENSTSIRKAPDAQGEDSIEPLMDNNRS